MTIKMAEVVPDITKISFADNGYFVFTNDQILLFVTAEFLLFPCMHYVHAQYITWPIF